MQITATARAEAVVERAKAVRSGRLTVTIGTGCCESTAPFLYEDFWPGPDQEPVGEVADVVIYAPAYLRDAYPADDGATLDVVDELAESLSIETEFSCRLVLRGAERVGSHSEGGPGERAPERCAVPAGAVDAHRPVVGEPPEALRGLRLR